MKLLIEDDEGNRSVVPVIRDEITIGRKEGNTIRLTERNVSRRHARLVRSSGRVFVEDVEARYGVKKNGKNVDERAEFNEGDVVVIGDYRLTLRPEKADAAQGQDVNGEAAEISPKLQEEESDESPSLTAPSELDEGGSEPDSPGTASATRESSSRAETEVIQTEPAELVVISSNFAGQKFPLDQKEMVIGRSEDCDIIIDHRSVSSTHAKVVREGHESYKIVDLNSRNGLKVDGDEYKSLHLERGDVVELGHVKFRFVAPGENYVFTPQSSSEEIRVEEPSDEDGGIGLQPIALAGIAVVLLGAGIGLALAVSSGDGAEGDDQETQAAATTPEESSGQEESGGDTDEKVAEKLDQAERKIEAGKLDKAIGSLESIRDLLEPTPEQSKTIDKLLSTAKREQPFRQRYQGAENALEDEEYPGVLEELSGIPEHSVFYRLARENDLKEQALDGLVDEIEKAVEEGDGDKAREKAEVAMEYQSHQSEAKKALAKLETSGGNDDEPESEPDPAGEIAAVGQADREPATNDPPDDDDGARGETAEPEAGSSDQPSTGASGGGGGGSDDGVTEAEAKELFQSATKKWVRGDHAGAIGDCQRALRADHPPCYRVIGMAQKQMGNKAAACKYFGEYLEGDPSDATKIRSTMDDLGCE